MAEIRRIKEKDFPAFVEIIRNAYPTTTFKTSEEKDSFTKRLITIQNEDEHVDFYGYYRDNHLIGCMRLHDYRMNWMNQKIPVSAIGLVGVDLLHKKERIAKEMISCFLEESYSKGAYFALLYPFRPDFYKKMEFGFGPELNHYRVKPNVFPCKGKKEELIYIDESYKEKLAYCYQTYTDVHHGMIEKTPFELDRIFNNNEHRIIGFMKNDKLDGYMIFHFEKAHDNNFVKNNLVIDEWITLTREAQEGFFTFLHTQNDQIHRIVFNTMNDAFYYLFADPRNETDNIIPHVYHEMHTSGVGLMYKLLDIEGFFKNIKSVPSNMRSLGIQLQVTDSFKKVMETLTLKCGGSNKIRINETRDFDVEIKLDISDLSSIVMGAVSFSSLYKLGLVDISDAKYLNDIDIFFSTNEKPVCMTGF